MISSPNIERFLILSLFIYLIKSTMMLFLGLKFKFTFLHYYIQLWCNATCSLSDFVNFPLTRVGTTARSLQDNHKITTRFVLNVTDLYRFHYYLPGVASVIPISKLTQTLVVINMFLISLYLLFILVTIKGTVQKEELLENMKIN